MTLDNFEDVVEDKIVHRGFDYYESERIEDVEQIDTNEFSATVYGTEIYDVFIKLDNQQKVLEHLCNCPYDWGAVCKHEVAVLYYIKDSELYKEPVNYSKMTTLKANLNKLEKSEMVHLLLELSKRNKDVRESIEDEF